MATDAARGRTEPAARAMELEGRVRVDAELRADRFTEAWQAKRAELGSAQTLAARGETIDGLKLMAAAAGKDAALMGVLDKRLEQLGANKVGREARAFDVLRELIPERHRDMER